MLDIIINMSMLTLFGWYISHYAKNDMPRLIWSGIGLYFMAKGYETNNFLFDPNAYFGLGVLLPHLIFLFGWVNEVINTLKLAFQNTYYFFITVYYKTRNTFYWFIDFYENIRAYFYKKKNKKAYEKFYKDDDYRYEEPKREQKQEQTYKRQQEERPKSETKKDYGEYGRFYEKDPYVVLGVNRSDDYKTIKKAYKKLINEYHPDVNPDDIEQCTEIAQLINGAWEKVEGYKK